MRIAVTRSFSAKWCVSLSVPTVSPERALALSRATLVRDLRRKMEGLLGPIIDHVLPMADVKNTRGVMEADETFGKIVLA